MSSHGSRKRTRSGGQRQRVQQILQDDAPEILENSHLAEHLLARWAWGEMSPQEVQTIASLAMDDLKNNRSTRKLQPLASVGTFRGVRRLAISQTFSYVFTPQEAMGDSLAGCFAALCSVFEHLPQLQGHLGQGRLPKLGGG